MFWWGDCPNGYHELTKYNHSDKNIEKFRLTTIEVCKDKCTTNLECVAFAHGGPYRVCILYSSREPNSHHEIGQWTFCAQNGKVKTFLCSLWRNWLVASTIIEMAMI